VTFVGSSLDDLRDFPQGARRETGYQLDKSRSARGRSGYWHLQDAKARFSELVRKVRSEGPQHVTVHGRDEVVVIAAEEFHRTQRRIVHT
jgi:prevent-host-death family protein